MSEPFEFDLTRRRVLTKNTKATKGKKCIIYWMSRDQRAHDNWALLYAHYLAAEMGGVEVKVVFNIVPKFLEATIRQYDFMMEGLKEVEGTLRDHHTSFEILRGWPTHTLPEYIAKEQPAAVICDMSPLRVPMQWVMEVAAKLDGVNDSPPLYQVDAHNVVPVWVASDKQEYAARTIRRKIESKLPQYLTSFPTLPSNAATTCLPIKIDWESELANIEVDRSVGKVQWAKPGYTAGMKVLAEFVNHRLKIFCEKRNDPNQEAISNTSPYTHFGQISAQAAAKYAKKHGKSHSKGVASFVEELIVRRELADNFCFYNSMYDSLKGAANWAQDSLQLHASDKREYLYTREQLQAAKSHDPLWNAAQQQLVDQGKMHGFLRMYWAKKILEWTASPEIALGDAIYLNDRYSLDGRDPNGYVGCMWSICGIHDQGWAERAVFGKIRFMNYQGCKRKFDVKAFEQAFSKRAPPSSLEKAFQKSNKRKLTPTLTSKNPKTTQPLPTSQSTTTTMTTKTMTTTTTPSSLSSSTTSRIAKKPKLEGKAKLKPRGVQRLI
eukprot:m.206304 g.206304  ORF g.206304 m.206304 type:complete len:550 (-) comp32948_c0_seq3:86-1735(-)